MTKKAKTLENQPAQPTLEISRYSEGLTKREYFAGLAMQSIIGNIPNIGCSKKEYAAYWAVEYADALLEELSKE